MRKRDLVTVLIAVTAALTPAAFGTLRAEETPAQAASEPTPSPIPAPVPQAAIPAPVPQAAVDPAPAAIPPAPAQVPPEQATEAPAEPSGQAPPRPAAATGAEQPASGAAAVEPQTVTPSAQPASAAAPGQPAPAASAVPLAASDPVVGIIRTKLADPDVTKGAHADDLAALQSFYAARSGPPLFITEMGFTARGQEAIFEIEKADDWGLDAKAFDLPPPGAIPANAEAQALAEIQLDLALLKYARHAQGGRVVPIQVSELYDQVPQIKAPASVLAEIEQAELPGDYLVSLQPKHDQFRRLHAALLEARGKPADEPKESDAGAKTDDSAAKASDDNKDGDKKDAAKDTKDKKDAAKDEKHAKLSERDIKRIIVNMERWRWMPEDLGRTYVWNNSPEFMLYVIKDGKPIYADKILVGTSNYATPVFTDEMETIVFNPDWIAPETVVKENLLPHLRAGNYSVLKTHKLSVSYNGTPVNVAKVDWGRVNVLSYTFLQKGGPGNNLGKIKFLYPNKHVVYMHDTLPVRKKYFKEKVRMIGHECVRMEKPLSFAEVLLAEANSMPAAKVKELWDKGMNAPVSLQNKLPVHMVYFTAVVDEKGKLSTFNDVYGLDRKLAAALFKDANGFPAPPPDKSTAAVVSASRSGGRSASSSAGGGGFASSLGFIDN